MSGRQSSVRLKERRHKESDFLSLALVLVGLLQFSHAERLGFGPYQSTELAESLWNSASQSGE